MMTFSEIIDEMNKKKALLISTYLNRARDAMKRLGFAPAIGSR